MQVTQKIGSRPYTVDFTNRQLTFLDQRFYFAENGVFVPSVTTVLEAYPKGAAFYEWLKKNGEDSDSIRDEAGRRGSLVHGLTERYDNGEEINLVNENGEIQMKVGEWAMFERYVDFRKRFNFDIDLTEQNFISPGLGFAGTLDRIITMDGKRILVDIKTSGSIWASYWLQLAAYKALVNEALPEMKIDGVAILWLNAKTRTDGKKGDIQGKGWQLVQKEDTAKDWAMFQATQKLWLAENGGTSPRQMVYQLSHKL